MRSHRREWCCAVALLAWTSLAGSRAAAAAPSWESIGPDGGSVFDVQVSAADPRVVFAIAGRGVYRSGDGGASWVRCTPAGTAPPGSIAVLGAHGAIVVTSVGVWRTVDDGATWQLASHGLPHRTGFITAIAASPSKPGVVSAVAASRTNQTFFYRSINGGLSWNRRAALPFVAGGLLWADPRDANHLVIGADSGLATSDDGGRSWALAKDDLAHAAISALAGAPAPSRVVYAGAIAYLGSTFTVGVYRSDDGGRHWKPVGAGLPEQDPTALLVDPVAPTTVLAAYADGELFRSDDAGATWERSPLALPAESAVVRFAARGDAGGRYFAAALSSSDEGAPRLFASTDAGRTWSPSVRGMAATTVWSLAVANGGSVFAMTNEALVLRRSTSDWEAVLDAGPTSGTAAVMADPAAPGVVFAVGRDATWRSIDDGDHWSRIHDALTSLTADPTDGSRLFAMGSYLGPLLRSGDRGDTWSTVSVVAGVDAQVSAVAVGQGGRVYAESPASNAVGATFYASDDHGSSWTPHASAFGGFLQFLAVDPLDDRVLYASPQGGTLRRSVDEGATWSDIGSALDGPALALYAEPASGRLHVVTASGHAFVSGDRGSTFVAEGDSPWSTSAYALAGDAQSGALYVGTNGAGVWRLEQP